MKWSTLVESQIHKAQAEGQLDDLRGAGKPLPKNQGGDVVSAGLGIMAEAGVLPNEIVLKKRRITADTALRLGKYFKVSPDFWLGLQMDFDLDTEIDRLGDRLDNEVGQYVGGSTNG